MKHTLVNIFYIPCLIIPISEVFDGLIMLSVSLRFSVMVFSACVNFDSALLIWLKVLGGGIFSDLRPLVGYSRENFLFFLLSTWTYFLSGTTLNYTFA